MMRRVQRISAQGRAGFTLIEIALSLTIIAFALIAIIGVLPHGMRVQKDNREETIINQDAMVLMDILRSGSRGADELTNYVWAIVVKTNSFMPECTYVSPYQGPGFSLNNIQPSPLRLFSGTNIVGLMSMPRYRDAATNTVTVYMRAISGDVSDQPPQVDPSVRSLAFSYRLTAEVCPYFSEIETTNTETPLDIAIAQNLQTNLYELRLTFRWPLLPDGSVGGGKLTFRTLASGTMMVNPWTVNGPDLYFIRPSTFTQALSD